MYAPIIAPDENCKTSVVNVQRGKERGVVAERGIFECRMAVGNKIALVLLHSRELQLPVP